MNSTNPEPTAAGLPFDPVQTLRAGLRVRPVDFAKLCGVSKATVSGWIKRGLCDLGPDGRLDPAAAAKQVMARADPQRLRAPLLRRAAESVSGAQSRADALAAEVAGLRRELAAERRLRAQRYIHEEVLYNRLSRYRLALLIEFPRLMDAFAAGRLNVELIHLEYLHIEGAAPAEAADEREMLLDMPDQLDAAQLLRPLPPPELIEPDAAASTAADSAELQQLAAADPELAEALRAAESEAAATGLYAVPATD